MLEKPNQSMEENYNSIDRPIEEKFNSHFRPTQKIPQSKKYCLFAKFKNSQ